MSYYEKLVKEQGLEAAREYMRELRSKVVKPGFSSMSEEKRQEIARLGGQARAKKARQK